MTRPHVCRQLAAAAERRSPATVSALQQHRFLISGASLQLYVTPTLWQHLTLAAWGGGGLPGRMCFVLMAADFGLDGAAQECIRPQVMCTSAH